MKSVVVVVEIPQNEQQWKGFLAASGTIPKNGHIEQLADNVWQIDFATSPTTFAQLLHAMKQFRLPGRILPLDTESQWLPVDSNRAST